MCKFSFDNSIISQIEINVQFCMFYKNYVYCTKLWNRSRGEYDCRVLSKTLNRHLYASRLINTCTSMVKQNDVLCTSSTVVSCGHKSKWIYLLTKHWSTMLCNCEWRLYTVPAPTNQLPSSINFYKFHNRLTCDSVTDWSIHN